MSAAGPRLDWTRVYLLVGGVLVAAILAAAAIAFTTRRAPRTVLGWERYAAPGSVLGSPDAPVRIVEFTNYQCRYCALAHPVLRRAVERHGGRVAVIVRHLALEGHPHAFEAAVAAECAGAGGRFWEYSDLLFEQQDSIGRKTWGAFALQAGVADTARFARCVAGGETAARVRADAAAAAELGIRGTPTYLVNGRVAMGTQTDQQLETLIGAALRTAR